LANVWHRSLFKSKLDLLVGVEWNKDTNYFSNIVESCSRDLHCYIAQVNTSQFGDSRITQPVESARLDILRLKGGTNDAILIAEIDLEGNIVAFLGLSLIPTKHKLIIENKTFYTWCVIDAILFTEWLDVTSVTHSNDPIDNTPIELKMKGNQLISSNPYPLFVSWVESMNTCDIRNSLCNHVSFFASDTTSNQWLKENANGKVITIDDFFEVVK